MKNMHKNEKTENEKYSNMENVYNKNEHILVKKVILNNFLMLK